MEEQEAVGAGMPAGLEAVSPESDNAAEDKDPTTISKETHSAVNEETATNQEPINENDLNTKVEDSLGVNKSPDNNLESEELRENSTEDLDQIASFLESTKNDKDTEESTKEVENQEADEEKVVENNVDCESEREVDENEDGSKLNADIGENCDKVSGENVGESEGGKSGDVEESRKDDDVEQEKCEESEEVASREVHQNGPEEGPELKDEEKEEKTMLDSSLDQDKDDRGDPEFESATADVTHDDINSSQVLDPFDELLKGPSEPIASDAKSSDAITDYNLDNLDNDMDAGGIDDSGALDDDNNDDHAEDHADVTDDALADGAIVADLNEGQGADEEVCLLPDTEREISEADKLKALASKKIPEPSTFDSLLSGSTTAGGDGEVEEEIHQVKGEESADGRGEADAHADDGIEAELNNIHGDSEAVDDSEAAEAEKDKEGEAEEEIPDNVEEEDLLENVIQEITEVEQTCVQCSESKKCTFRFMSGEETKYLCEKACVDAYQAANPDNTYELSQKKVYIKEIVGIKRNCSHCLEDKYCYYEILGEGTRLCTLVCLEAVTGENPSKYVITKKSKFVQEINEKEGTCLVCSETKQCLYEVKIDGEMRNICSQACLQNLQLTQPNLFKLRKKKPVKPKLTTPLLKLKVMGNATDKYLDQGNRIVAKTPEQVAEARADRERSFLRKCANCKSAHLGNDKNLSWETMDFCNESCLGKYQNLHGSHCANCKNEVSVTSLGKYCVRFGYDIRQFCCSGCLEEFKKGLKICCYCQRDISVGFEGFLAPVGDKGQFKDFCSQFCVEKFDQMSKNPVPPPVWAHCAVCSKEKPTTLEVALDDKSPMRLCSEPCFTAFKFVNHIFTDQCRWCNKYFVRKSAESYTIYSDEAAHCFCTKACMNVYISNSRHIVPCNWCKVKKYNFDMIKRTLDNGQAMMMCSLNCLTLYQVSVNAVSSKRIKCDQCKRTSQAQYHLTMSDATVRNFCTYQCVMSFQGQYSKAPLVMEGEKPKQQAVPTGAPRRTLALQRNSAKSQSMKMMDQRSGLPVIASVQSLATPAVPLAPLPTSHGTRGKSKRLSAQDRPVRAPTPPPVIPPKPVTPPPPPKPQIYNHVIIAPTKPKELKNKGTSTKPLMVSKGVTCRPHPCTKECQTDNYLEKRMLIPVPVPIYVPVPVAMWSIPFPVPTPIPLPIPVPVFIPTTRNSATGIMKEIKKIHEKMPTDPFEAELLMMAEMVAGEKKKVEESSDSEEENGADDGFSPDVMDTGNSAFGEDVLQMALKMATEYEEPAVDLESAMTASTITPSSHPNMPPGGLDENNPMHHHQLMMLEQQRAAAAAAANSRKRTSRTPAPPAVPAPAITAPRTNKRSRRQADPPQPAQHHQMPEPMREPIEKPDANMCLKYTFGVNAWKQWVITKNAEMEKSTVRRKPFKPEILQLTADELNYSLCLFVKEVRKPNGSEYAPDTIYYLVLGIQQYLFENGRIDNIFTDSYYEKFTECLDEVARKFSVLYNDSQYIVTRVEEEHLWESKQLGAHSPHVLLSTLMFFNTKHFNLVTVEEHMQLSFSHIMKHWKRNPNQPGAGKIPGSRNVLLRFYPPQSALEANSRKKKVYEQHDNEENPLRCPVKLYEFYLSKCPESVKTRNDVFYLMPERSCVPDSPVWYSTQALGREPLSKMLHRVKMVKEINIALLTS